MGDFWKDLPNIRIRQDAWAAHSTVEWDGKALPWVKTFNVSFDATGSLPVVTMEFYANVQVTPPLRGDGDYFYWLQKARSLA